MTSMNGCSSVIGLAAVAGGVLGNPRASQMYPRDTNKAIQYTIWGAVLGVAGGIVVGVLLVVLMFLLQLFLGAVGMGMGMAQQSISGMY